MKMQLKQYPMLAAALVLLSVMACNQREVQPEQGFLSQCDKVKKHIAQALAIASDLENFNWSEFSKIGMVYPPQGMCSIGTLPIVEKISVTGEALKNWVSLAEQLPSPQTAKTYSIQCNNCLKLAADFCLRSPYNESQTRLPEAEKVTVSQWQELCSQLQSASQGAEYMVSKNKTIAADYTIPELITYFIASDEQIKQNYLDRFMTESDKYIQLHDELIYNIQQAIQGAIELANWQPSPQGIGDE
jgi:hypothetical protein